MVVAAVYLVVLGASFFGIAILRGACDGLAVPPENV
jgi:hypothetical protein